MNRGELPLDLQYDLYTRYALIRDILSIAFSDDSSFIGRTVLDVGAGPSYVTERFLDKRFRVVRSDIADFGDPGIVVLLRGQPFPLDDNSFDAVIAMDVLEHIPCTERQMFLAECLRTSQFLTVVAAPIGTAEVEAAERCYAAVFERLFNRKESFLIEHAKFGVPRPDDVRAMTSALNTYVIEVDNVLISDWLAFNVIDLFVSTIDDGYSAKGFLNKRLNSRVPANYDGGQHYRRFYVLIKDQGVREKLERGVSSLRTPLSSKPNTDALTALAEQFCAYVRDFNAPFVLALNADISAKDAIIHDQDTHLQALNADISAKDAIIHDQDTHLQAL
ncbi:MAG: class I SAM-dependent methyltransferase, partial [Candidatus Binatia bacterium]